MQNYSKWKFRNRINAECRTPEIKCRMQNRKFRNRNKNIGNLETRMKTTKYQNADKQKHNMQNLEPKN